MSLLDEQLSAEVELDLASEDENVRRNAVNQLPTLPHALAILEKLKEITAQDPSSELRFLAKKHYGQIKEKMAEELRVLVNITPETGIGVDPKLFGEALWNKEPEIRLEAIR